MRKKQYDKPSMKVVALQQRTALLAGSNVGGGITQMGNPEELSPEFIPESEDLLPAELK